MTDTKQLTAWQTVALIGGFALRDGDRKAGKLLGEWLTAAEQGGFTRRADLEAMLKCGTTGEQLRRLCSEVAYYGGERFTAIWREYGL